MKMVSLFISLFTFFFSFSTHPLVERHYSFEEVLQRLRGKKLQLSLHDKALRRVLLTALHFVLCRCPLRTLSW